MRVRATTLACGIAAAALTWVGCTSPVEKGERLYREGDRLGALELWRAIPENARAYPSVKQRIEVVEAEVCWVEGFFEVFATAVIALLRSAGWRSRSSTIDSRSSSSPTTPRRSPACKRSRARSRRAKRRG